MLAINRDVLFTILSLLPARSVVRFKGVSKLWQSVISDPYFIKSHANNCNFYNNAGFICSNPETHCSYLFDGALSSAPDLSLSILKHDAESMRIGLNLNVYVLRSFYGLLICPVMWEESEFQSSFEFIYIYNPMTMQYKRISQVKRCWSPVDVILTPNHKLIMFSFNTSTFSYQIRMYISYTQSWKFIYSFPMGELIHKQQKKGIFLNRTVYWVLQIDNKWSVFSLNVESLIVQKLALPDHCDDFYQESLYFGECQGRLHLVMEQKQYDFIFKIMQMKEDFTGWNLLHFIDLKFMRDIIPPPTLSRRQMIIEEGEYEEEDYLWDQIEKHYEGQDHASALAPIHMVLGERSEDYELLFIMTVPKFDSEIYQIVRRAIPRIYSYNLNNKTLREIMNVTNTGGFYTAAQINSYCPMLTPP